MLSTIKLAETDLNPGLNAKFLNVPSLLNLSRNSVLCQAISTVYKVLSITIKFILGFAGKEVDTVKKR